MVGSPDDSGSCGHHERPNQDTVTPQEPDAAATPTKPKGWAAFEGNHAPGYFQWSTTVRFVQSSLIGFVFALLVLLVADLDSVVHSYSRTAHLERAASWAALVGVVFAIVMLGDPRLRRGGGSAEQVAAYDRALRSGQLPADIEPDVWRGWLRRGLRSERNLRVLRICFLTAVGVSAILTHPTVYRWVIASLYELLAMRFIITWPAVRARYARLAAEVEQRATRQIWG
jgi:hypothetical protein